MTKKFKIEYFNKTTLITTENRTHTTGVRPSLRMIRGVLHFLWLDEKEGDLKDMKAKLYEDGTFVGNVKMLTR